MLNGDATLKRDFNYYIITYNTATRVIESFVLNDKKVARARSFSGFFPIMTHGVDYGPMKHFIPTLSGMNKKSASSK